MYLLIICLPFFGSFIAGFFGRHIGSKGASIVTTFCLFVSFLISIIIFYESALIGCSTFVKLESWINSGSLTIDWGFIFDSLTATMLIIVTFISFLVHLYSIEYMSHDPHLPRFMSYLSLFTFFMLILVTSDNFVQMFIGWEGVGLCSYLLINFWYTRIQANKAAIKAMLLNRVGDFSLLIGIMFTFYYFESVDYLITAALVPFVDQKFCVFNIHIKVVSVISLFFFIGAVGKSAQIGLHTWLPDAMEGPTPVSALIHAATMVTAGVFLLARVSFIFEQSNNVLQFITFIGASTCFFAASVGLVQNDLKRVIAYSTCSQLGYMIFACGLSGYSTGVFHLSNHAFFKALLFLSAGSVIHAVSDEQDMRKMGGLKNVLPFTYSMIIIGSLALAGFPFLSGFYSKDLILELALGKYSFIGTFAYILGTISAFFTAFYSTRLIFLTFLSKPNGYKPVISFATESGFKIIFVLSCLSLPSIFIGYFTKDMLVGPGSSFFNSVIFLNSFHFNKFDEEFSLPIVLKLLPVSMSVLGIIIALIFYFFNNKLLIFFKTSVLGLKLYKFLNQKWYFDKIYNEIIGQTFFKFGYSSSYKIIDRCVFEMIGPTGLSIFMMQVSSNLHKLQTSHLTHYTLIALSGFTFYVAFKQIIFNYYFFNMFILLTILIVFGFLQNKNGEKIIWRV